MTKIPSIKLNSSDICFCISENYKWPIVSIAYNNCFYNVIKRALESQNIQDLKEWLIVYTNYDIGNYKKKLCYSYIYRVQYGKNVPNKTWDILNNSQHLEEYHNFLIEDFIREHDNKNNERPTGSNILHLYNPLYYYNQFNCLQKTVRDAYKIVIVPFLANKPK